MQSYIYMMLCECVYFSKLLLLEERRKMMMMMADYMPKLFCVFDRCGKKIKILLSIENFIDVLLTLFFFSLINAYRFKYRQI